MVDRTSDYHGRQRHLRIKESQATIDFS